MRRGIFGFDIWFYGIVALLLAVCQQPLVLGGLMLFVMLVEKDGHRFLRKVKKLDAMNVLLQSYDREYAGESCALPEISFVGRAVRVEFSL